MTSLDLLYPAVIVFTLMIVGLFLTVAEFNKHENNTSDRDLELRKKGK